MKAGTRNLKDNLSRDIRGTAIRERIAATAHGRLVSELVPPSVPAPVDPRRYGVLVARRFIRPALESRDPLEGWPDIRLPAGTAAALIDSDRGDA